MQFVKSIVIAESDKHVKVLEWAFSCLHFSWNIHLEGPCPTFFLAILRSQISACKRQKKKKKKKKKRLSLNNVFYIPKQSYFCYKQTSIGWVTLYDTFKRNQSDFSDIYIKQSNVKSSHIIALVFQCNRIKSHLTRLPFVTYLTKGRGLLQLHIDLNKGPMMLYLVPMYPSTPTKQNNHQKFVKSQRRHICQNGKKLEKWRKLFLTHKIFRNIRFSTGLWQMFLRMNSYT